MSSPPWGTEWVSQAGQQGQGAHSTGEPACSVVPKFVWGHRGPSLIHVDGQHGLDCRELVAGEIGEQLLGATPGRQDLKTHAGPLLGAQIWHAVGKGTGQC